MLGRKGVQTILNAGLVLSTAKVDKLEVGIANESLEFTQILRVTIEHWYEDDIRMFIYIRMKDIVNLLPQDDNVISRNTNRGYI